MKNECKSIVGEEFIAAVQGNLSSYLATQEKYE